ncbi:MAG: hypothetical protein Q8M76_03420 [Spirochaetaceae bacterium]|nr:hypothetical protein [Spirochaetaceae bacterium]
MDTPDRLYMVLHPNHSMIASQLDPERFARHYVQGSTRYVEGKLIFAEIDPSWRHPYFEIDEAFAQLTPHEDGRPKATKFIRSYRVLENVDFSAIGKLYVCNPVGDVVELESRDDDPRMRGDEMRIILEINPIKMMVLTRYNFVEYSRFITDPRQPKGAPAMFYGQLDFNADDFLGEFGENPLMRCLVPGIHPARLRAGILEVRNTPGKMVKGISLDCPIDRISYKVLRHGFMFAGQKGNKFYPLLPLQDVERRFYKFWKNM